MKSKLLIFQLDDDKYALYADEVERIIRAVEILPLPGAPQIVCGIINLAGIIVPVFDIRSRFNLPLREVHINDRIIIINSKKRRVSILVDSAEELIEFPQEELINPDQILPDLNYIDGVVKLKTGLVLVNNINKFLTIDEEEILDKVLIQ